MGRKIKSTGDRKIRQGIKKLFPAMLLSLALLGSSMPVYAQGSVEEQPEVVIAQPVSTVSQPATTPGDGGYNSVPEMGSKEEAVNYLREMIKRRVVEVTFFYDGDWAIDEIGKEVFEHTGRPDEGDYLLWNCGGYITSMDSGTGKRRIAFRFDYYTDAEQEKTVETEISRALSSLGVYSKSQPEKVRLIHDWIADRVEYDFGSNDGMEYTTYSAIVRGKAVCQGYATLLYRMLLTAGVDNRVITGVGNGDLHAWNIIRLGDKYFNTDVTWDDGLGSKEYYLKCNAHFPDHIRDGSMDTADFNRRYPMSSADYSGDSYYAPYSLDSIYGIKDENKKNLADKNTPESSWNCVWDEVGGKYFWYENGSVQGTESDPKSFTFKGTIRGREIYDPATNAWYWLDAVYGGAKATNKEVFMPYVYSEEERHLGDENWVYGVAGGSNLSDPDTVDMSVQVANAILKHGQIGAGKWVRYDENGKMIKGWYTVKGADAAIYPDQVGNTYYYDHKTGLMAKGWYTINGQEYHFNETTGVLDK